MQLTNKVKIGIVWSSILFALIACNSKNELTYNVTGTASEAEISFTDAEGNSQKETIALPWQTSLKVSNDVDFALEAKRSSPEGTVKCEVQINEDSLVDIEGQVFAACRGSFTGNASTYQWNSVKESDPPDIFMPVVAKDIQAALDTGLPEVNADWSLGPYEQSKDCQVVDENMVKTEFSLQFATGWTAEPCSAEVTSYAVFRDREEDTSFLVELPWFSHSSKPSEAVEQGWQLLEEQADNLVATGDGIRLENVAELEYGDIKIPMVDVVKKDAKVILKRMALIPGKNGAGMGFFAERLVETSVVQSYAEFDALTRKMIASMVIDSFTPSVIDVWLTNELNEDGSPVKNLRYFPEESSQVLAVLYVKEFLPELELDLTWLKEDDVIFEEKLAWGERASEGYVSFPLTTSEPLDLGHYQLNLKVSDSDLVLEQSQYFTIGRAEGDYLDEILDLHYGGESDRAIVTAEKALQLYPDSAALRNNLGLVLRQTGEPDRATEVLNQALAIDSEFANPYYQLGVIYQDAADDQRALNYYTNGLKLENASDSLKSEMHLNRGVIYYFAEDLETAYADFARAIELEPANTQALYNYAVTARRLENYQEAIERLSQVAQIWTDNSDVYYQRALSYEAIGEKELAVADLQEVLALATNNHDLERAQEVLSRLEE